MEPDVSFVGIRLLPGKLTKVGGPINPESSIWTIHITQFALAAGAKNGKNTITLVQDNGDAFALGTLEKDRCEQFQGDFMLSQEFQLLNHGKSEVHLTGYQTTTDVLDPDADLESDDDEEPDIDPSILGRRRLAAIKAMEAAQNGLPDEDDSEDEDEDFEAADEDEEEDDDDDDDDDDAEAPAGVPLSEQQKLREAFKQGKKLEEEEESDSELDDEEDEMLRDAALQGESGSDEEDDDDEDDDEEEDSDVDLDDADDLEEQAELQTASKILKQQKRSAEAGKATPQPNKKAKLDTPSGTPAASEADKQWSKAIKAHLVKEGATGISSIGSVVRRPSGSTGKLKRLLEESKDFVIDAKGMVSLSK